MKKITAAITGVGAYLPDYLLTNDELSRMVDTSDEWIMTRIGIKTRHILKGEGLGTSYMGARAIKDLLEKHPVGINPLGFRNPLGFNGFNGGAYPTFDKDHDEKGRPIYYNK